MLATDIYWIKRVTGVGFALRIAIFDRIPLRIKARANSYRWHRSTGVKLVSTYARAGENLERLVAALGAHEPYLRGAPSGLPFRFDTQTLEGGLNFTLTTRLGDIDLLGEVVGGGGYEDLVPLFGLSCQCLDLPTLIRVKRSAGRPKDLDAISELQSILEETSAGDPSTDKKS